MIQRESIIKANVISMPFIYRESFDIKGNFGDDTK